MNSRGFPRESVEFIESVELIGFIGSMRTGGGAYGVRHSESNPIKSFML